MRRADVAGPVNVVAPQATTMTGFTSELAAALHRPALIPLPEPIVRVVFGQMGEETLLASTRAVPAALTASGFRFLHGDVAAGMQAGLHPNPELLSEVPRAAVR